MTDFEPYVADPAEPAPRARLTGVRPWVALAIAALLVAAFAVSSLHGDREDPSLDAPAGQSPAEDAGDDAS